MNFEQLREKLEAKSKFPAPLVSAAVKIALDMGGNHTGAVRKIEKMKKGLSDDPTVSDALRQANESVNENIFWVQVGSGRDSLTVKTRADSKKEALAKIKKEFPGSKIKLDPTQKQDIEEANLADFRYDIENEYMGTPIGKGMKVKQGKGKQVVLHVKGRDLDYTMKNAIPKLTGTKLVDLQQRSGEYVGIYEASELELREMTQRFVFDDLKKAARAEKMAKKFKLRADSAVDGDIYFVAVTGRFTDIEKWMKAVEKKPTDAED